MRHLGLIFSITSLPHIKSMVLAEATARVSKHILNQTTRSARRKTRAEVMQAEERGRSQDKDFREHNEKLRSTLTTRLVDFLNLVMGSSAESDAFWEQMILPLLASKFSLSLQAPKQRLIILHMPQLLFAIEHHCAVKVSERIDYDFKSASPINEADFKSFDTKVKWEPNNEIEAFRWVLSTAAFAVSPCFIAAFALATSHLAMLLTHRPTHHPPFIESLVLQAGPINSWPAATT